jgi:hypothetical protein
MRLSTTLSRNGFYVTFTYFTFLFSSIAPAQTNDLSRNAIIARLEGLKDFTVVYHLQTDIDVDPATESGNREMGLSESEPKRTESMDCTFSFFHENIRLSKERGADFINSFTKRKMSYPKSTTNVVTPDWREEALSEEDRGRKFFRMGGSVGIVKSCSEDWLVDLGLGIRLYRTREWLTPDDLQKATESVSDAPQIVILRIQGDNNMIHELHFDKNLMYALVYYKVLYPDGAFEEITSSDFHRNGNMFLPNKIVRANQYLDSEGKVRHPFTRTVTIQNYIIDDPENVPERFRIIWPAKLQIFDQRINQPVNVGPTSRPMTDEDIQKTLAEQSKIHDNL